MSSPYNASSYRNILAFATDVGLVAPREALDALLGEPAYKPTFPAVSTTPMKLAPIAWGKRDPELAGGVCRSILKTMPTLQIPYCPQTHTRLLAFLRDAGIATERGE